MSPSVGLHQARGRLTGEQEEQGETAKGKMAALRHQEGNQGGEKQHCHREGTGFEEDSEHWVYCSEYQKRMPVSISPVLKSSILPFHHFLFIYATATSDAVYSK